MFENISLPKNSPSEKQELIRYLTKYLAKELSAITKPCYYLKISRSWRDIIYLMGLDKTIIDEFKKTIPRKYKPRKILSEATTITVIHGIVHFLKAKEFENAKLFFYFLTLKFYGSLTHKYFPSFCAPEVWTVALDKISGKHNFKIHNGISNTLIFLADKEFEKTKRKFLKLKERDDEWEFLSRFVYSTRTRVEQSLRSFARTYYKLQKTEKLTIRKEREEEEEEAKASVPDEISTNICTYGQIDNTALKGAIIKSGIRSDLGAYVVKQISNVSYREDVKLILLLFNRIISLSEICNERKRNLLVRRVLSDVLVKGYYIKKHLIKLLKKIDEEYLITNINKNQSVGFLTNYLTFYVRRRIC